MTFYAVSNNMVRMKKYIPKTFRSGGKGLAKVLGPLEKDVMDVLWDSGPGTGKEVLAELRKGREIATTTVFTVLDRLAKKGLVRKTKVDKVFVFEPVCTRDEFARTASEEVLKGVMDLWSTSAVSSLVDIIAEKDPDELDRLSELINDKKRELEKR